MQYHIFNEILYEWDGFSSQNHLKYSHIKKDIHLAWKYMYITRALIIQNLSHSNLSIGPLNLRLMRFYSIKRMTEN